MNDAHPTVELWADEYRTQYCISQDDDEVKTSCNVHTKRQNRMSRAENGNITNDTVDCRCHLFQFNCRSLVNCAERHIASEWISLHFVATKATSIFALVILHKNGCVWNGCWNISYTNFHVTFRFLIVHHWSDMEDFSLRWIISSHCINLSH